eukprot:3638433-Rhodomonas_salina.3
MDYALLATGLGSRESRVRISGLERLGSSLVAFPGVGCTPRCVPAQPLRTRYRSDAYQIQVRSRTKYRSDAVADVVGDSRAQQAIAELVVHASRLKRRRASQTGPWLPQPRSCPLPATAIQEVIQRHIKRVPFGTGGISTAVALRGGTVQRRVESNRLHSWYKQYWDMAGSHLILPYRAVQAAHDPSGGRGEASVRGVPSCIAKSNAISVPRRPGARVV